MDFDQMIAWEMMIAVINVIQAPRPVRRLFAILLLPLSASSVFGSVDAAMAFECAAARSPTEVMICAKPSLKAADDSLVRTYSEILKRSDAANRQVLAESERRWLKLRDGCMSQGAEQREDCIYKDTQRRELELVAVFGSAEKPISPISTRPDGAKEATKIAAFPCPEPAKGPKYCSDPELRNALRELRATYDRAWAARPAEEREAFAEVVGPSIRISPACMKAGELDHACGTRQAKATAKSILAYEGTGPEQTGRLRFLYRERREPGDGQVTNILYVQFEQPTEPAERVFNREVLDAVWRDELLQPFDPATKAMTERGQKYEATSAVTSVHMSDRMLSAGISTWDCCGAHGMGGTSYVNVIRPGGARFDVAATFNMQPLAAACWRHLEGGKAFELNGEAAPDNDDKPSDRFLAALAATMSNEHVWSIKDQGVDIDFGFLGAYAFGPSSCTLETQTLSAALKPGRELPWGSLAVKQRAGNNAE